MPPLSAAHAIVRPAAPADAATLARLRWEFRGPLAPAVEDEATFVARAERWMAERLRAPGPWRCWVAEAEHGVLGHLWLQRIEKVPNPGEEPEAHAYVTNVFVREAARGQGVGSRLLEAALAWCRAERVQAAFLWPRERSRSLYRRHGFRGEGSLMELVLYQDGA